MKNWKMLSFLFFAITSAALFPVQAFAVPSEKDVSLKAAPAQPIDPVSAEAIANENDVLKDIMVHDRPNDFSTAQQLAIANREERIAMLEKANACIAKTTNMDEIYACQIEEKKTYDKIALSYCDTTIAFYSKRQQRTANKQKDVGPTECERALSAVTGKPIPKRSETPDIQVESAQ